MKQRTRRTWVGCQVRWMPCSRIHGLYGFHLSPAQSHQGLAVGASTTFLLHSPLLRNGTESVSFDAKDNWRRHPSITTHHDPNHDKHRCFQDRGTIVYPILYLQLPSKSSWSRTSCLFVDFRGWIGSHCTRTYRMLHGNWLQSSRRRAWRNHREI